MVFAARRDKPRARPPPPPPRAEVCYRGLVLLPLAQRLGRGALRLQGLESRMVPTAHADLHLYEAPGRGTLPTAVVLHGFGSAATPFARLILELRRGVRRVLAPDAPGHGFSGVPRERLTPEVLFASIAELLDREIDEPAIVFGSSLGGAMALRYALERPSKVRVLALWSPAGAPMDAAELAALLATFRMRSPADARALLDRLYHRPRWWAPLVARDIQALFERRAMEELTSSASPEQLLTPDRLAALAPPTLLLWGRSERLLPSSSLAFFKQHLPPHAVIQEPEGFGHCPHLERPAELADRVLAFARRAVVA